MIFAHWLENTFSNFVSYFKKLLGGYDNMRKRKILIQASVFLAVLVAGSVILPNICQAAISFSEHDFGEVEMGTTSTVVLTITSQEEMPTTITGLVFANTSCSDFSVISRPESMTISYNQSIDIVVGYTPSQAGTCSDTLRIYNGSPLPNSATFTGTGIQAVEAVQEVPEPLDLTGQYLMQIEGIRSFTKTSIEEGELKGRGKGKWAKRRLKVLNKMLATTSKLIENGDTEAAYNKLAMIHKKIDGNPEPKDFVEGQAKGALAAKVHGMITALKPN